MNGPLELWAGVECTSNRVGDRFLDQIAMSGHDARSDDLALFADLGIKTLRFPVIWERVCANPEQADWSWVDRQLARAQELGIQVIAGLVHHGSGPVHTDLLDPEFPHKLADFAATFADRYPWIDLHTPINEPLTTARFSGLYGLWYPHCKDTSRFLRMLLHQCQAIALAMRAIKKSNSRAQLVQTEDLGRIFSTSFLRYQAEFENERRWLSLDLLMGRLRPDHALWSFVLASGIRAEELEPFWDQPCIPDIIGINHYITSNRFLDERLERYPANCHGGNGRHRYADIEAVRVGAENISGPRDLLREAWERYQRPLAVTEVHLGCTRDEQLRWLKEVWESAEELRQEQIDVRAVTAWSLLGSYDWDSLLTQPRGHYESGIFDGRGSVPRATALARWVKTTAQGGSYDHPVLDTPGWWHRLDRLLYPSVALDASRSRPGLPSAPRTARPLLITGGPGTLATALAFLCERRGLAYHLTQREALDITDPQAVSTWLDRIRPWAVINAAGYGRVDQAESDADACLLANAHGPSVLAEMCAVQGIGLVTFSSDLVFDGQQEIPYLESDAVRPLNIYGHSKALAEEAVRRLHPGALIIRTSAFFGPWDESNFLIQTIRRMARGNSVLAPDDVVVSPTYGPDLLNACLDLLIDGESGIWHLANAGRISWYDLACDIADRQGFKRSLVQASRAETMDWKAARPRFSALGSERASLLPDLDHALNRFVRECRVAF